MKEWNAFIETIDFHCDSIVKYCTKISSNLLLCTIIVIKTLVVADLAMAKENGDVQSNLVKISTVQSNSNLLEFVNHDGGFYAEIFIIPYSQIEEFDKPFNEAPVITELNKAKVGDIIAVKLLFYGFEADSKSNANVTYDLVTLSPDGTVYSDAKYSQLPAIVGKTDMQGIFDNRTSLVALRFEGKDQKGTYIIKATITDNIGNRQIDLMKKISLE